jgi:hypothetical protein
MRLSVTPRRVLLLLVALALTIALGVYLERKTIARRFADAELAARKVNARYEIKAIGPKTQRLEHVVLGDPNSPDLTADWAEIELGVGLSGVGIRSVRAGGVRLRGHFVDGKLSLGAVDRLLPTPSGAPFTLPDIDLALNDTRLALETEYGAIAVRLDGNGNLAGGFAGKLLANMRQAKAGSLEAAGLAGRLAITTERRRIRIAGPVSAGRLLLAGNGLNDVTVRLKGSSSESFANVEADWSMSAAVERLLYGSARRLQGDGRFSLDGTGQRLTAKLELEGARPAPKDRARFAAAIPHGAGTPVEPLLRQLRLAVAGLDKGSVATAPLEYRASGGQRSLFVGPPTIIAASGAKLLGNGRGLVMPLDRGQATFDGEFALSGGGFPEGTVRLALASGNWSGTARFRPYRAGGAQLALAPVVFRYGNAGLGANTLASLDGPVGNGRVTGLSVPISLRPGRDPLAGCFAPGFRSLEIAGLRLAPASLNVCLAGNEARLAPARLAGRLGDSAIQLEARGARIGFSRGDFTVNGLAVRLGGEDRLSLLDVSELTGRFGAGNAAGHFLQATGQIGNVPLKMSDGNGNWQYSGGVLTLHGGLRVADGAAKDPRFNPLVVDDFSLRFADNRIVAGGIAREPKTLAQVADVRISHDLAPGTGSAIIDVADLTFGRTLQPEMLTTTTLGVIANVVGTIAGRGEIRWTPKDVRSSGVFRTDSLDMAAAFGPVTGLKGEIALSDLLGIETGPGQFVRVASINPGIAVIDGDIHYQLLPGLKLGIEGGRWPFAGGWLILEPTIIDLSEAAERRLTFRVEGLDAGQFINQLQFENIDATGVYDGTLPMIFDEHGGRIEGGRLVARNGGTLAYVGEISNQNLGTMGRVAFDALKSIKYHRLSIDLNGPLDGDVVTRVSFAGVNQAPIEGVRAKFPIPVRVTGLTNFPFIFNVTITAPFRKLFDMSRTISDPSLLIERLNPDLQRIGPAKTIQPPESEPMR